MEPERWGQIKRIVNACLDMEPARRPAHIAGACAGDPSLSEEVESLLAFYMEEGDFLETPALAQAPEEILTGREIGHYRLCEPIADGGMGTVYRAVRASDYRQQVAIKLVKRGMDTDYILRRFRRERQILAGLDHPNIARLLDGGATEDGRPYLVMEYIEGAPITGYCEQRKLGISERLELFRAVCSAVHYAHQNLVVHRDLKPGNILVTPQGAPKLLDFGIAKLLEPDTGSTITSMQLMTPQWASPEQARGEPVTTASDIYSLGLLLYTLLTGERPYEFPTRTPEEVRRIICETEPKRPSAVRSLSADLDVIVLKAMHKEPARRYVSADQLSEDIHRYLEGLPVTARKDTFGYRAAKFLRRHKTGTLAAGLVALSLIGGMGATLREAREARLERARAERRFNDVRELADSLIFELHDAVQNLPGSTAARKLIVDRALRYLDRLSAEASNDNSLRRELAAAYLKLGQVQGRAGSANLGDTAGAIASLRKSVNLRQVVVAANPSSSGDRRALASAYDELGDILAHTGDAKGMEECDRQALALRQALAGRLSKLESDQELSLSYYHRGLHRMNLGDFAGGLENYRKSLEAAQSVARAQPENAGRQRGVSTLHKRIGALLAVKNQFSEALEHYQAAQKIDEELVSANPNNAASRLDLTFAYSDIGFISRKRGDLPTALANYRKAEAIREELAAADPKDERAREILTSSKVNIGYTLWEMGDRKGSMASHRKALTMRESLLAANPASRSLQADIAQSCASLGYAYATLAAESHSVEDRLTLWRQARGFYQRAGRIVTDLKSGGPLPPQIVGTDTEVVAGQLSKCDAAIEKLTASSAP